MGERSLEKEGWWWPRSTERRQPTGAGGRGRWGSGSRPGPRRGRRRFGGRCRHLVGGRRARQRRHGGRRRGGGALAKALRQRDARLARWRAPIARSSGRTAVFSGLGRWAAASAGNTAWLFTCGRPGFRIAVVGSRGAHGAPVRERFEPKIKTYLPQCVSNARPLKGASQRVSEIQPHRRSGAKIDACEVNPRPLVGGLGSPFSGLFGSTPRCEVGPAWGRARESWCYICSRPPKKR
jgi:hypothetical protein